VEATGSYAEKRNFHCHPQCQASGRIAEAAAGTAAVTLRTTAGTAGAGTNGAAGEAASRCAIAVGRPFAAFAASTVVAEVSEWPDLAHCQWTDARMRSGHYWLSIIVSSSLRYVHCLAYDTLWGLIDHLGYHHNLKVARPP
jgi:hypothetical protein